MSKRVHFCTNIANLTEHSSLCETMSSLCDDKRGACAAPQALVDKASLEVQGVVSRVSTM